MNQFKRSMYLKLIIIVSCLSYILYRFKSVNFNLNTSGSSDSTWTRVSLTRDDFTVLVTSTVYYDDRRNDRRYLRMHWIHSQDTPTAFWHNIRFILLKNSGEEVMIRDHKRIGQFVLARHFLGQSHKQFMMSLDLTQHIEDIEDKILMFSTGHTKNHTLHIHRPQTNNPLKFAVCVKPFYGTFPDKYIPRLIEWFEINRLFGISEFHFYNATMKETLYFNRVLTHYKHFVHIHQFGAGFAVKSDTEEFEAAEVLTRAALSDCIYRNYNRLEYLLVIDIDEMIIPRYHQDYTSLINTLNLSSDPYDQPSSILFVMSMFYSVYGQDDSQPDYLHTMKYRSRIIYDNGQLRNLATSAKRTKSFINIKTCVLAFHHYCRVPISNNTEMFMLVPSSVAMLHHYRDEFKWRRVTLKETPSRDDVMLQYKQYLEKPVWEVIKEVMY